jgi:hypothetical protein
MMVMVLVVSTTVPGSGSFPGIHVRSNGSQNTSERMIFVQFEVALCFLCPASVAVSVLVTSLSRAGRKDNRGFVFNSKLIILPFSNAAAGTKTGKGGNGGS